jgi:hypothetical protein
VSTAPERWRTALADLGREVARVRLHGVTAAELDEARSAVLAQSEESRQREATRPAREILRELNGAVIRREPPLSAAQRLALLRRLLPALTPAEVSRAFAAAFDGENVVVVATLPPRPDVPGQAELVALGSAALAARPDPPADRSSPRRSGRGRSPSRRSTRRRGCGRPGSPTACACTTAAWSSGATRPPSPSRWRAASSRRGPMGAG